MIHSNAILFACFPCGSTLMVRKRKNGFWFNKSVSLYSIHFHAFHQHFWCAQRCLSVWCCGRQSREMFCRFCFAESCQNTQKQNWSCWSAQHQFHRIGPYVDKTLFFLIMQLFSSSCHSKPDPTLSTFHLLSVLPALLLLDVHCVS